METNPFDESESTTIEPEVKSEVISNPFDDSVDAINPFDEDAIPTKMPEPNEVITSDLSENTKVETEIGNTDDIQPKPDFPKGVGMQTQGQPYNAWGSQSATKFKWYCSYTGEYK